MPTLRKSTLLAATSALSIFAGMSPAQAQDGDFILNTRLRAEFVDQDGRKDAEALTLRARAGYNLKIAEGWHVLAEGEAVVHLTDSFADTVETRPGYAVVADPEALELNRLQIGYKDKKTAATVGRQRIILGSARFVGNVGFRQNEQTFDAVRASHKFTDNLSAEYVYIDKVHRIFGDDSPVGNWSSDSHVMNVGAKTGFGDINAYGLLLDFSNAAGASGQTWGANWSKRFETDFGKVKLRAEGAIQSDYNGNGPISNVGYQALGVDVSPGKITANIGIEILEGSGGRGFITPLATLHKFQGWADVFLATPATGIRDIQFGLKGKADNFIADAKPISWALQYHDFASDNGKTGLGDEIDAVVTIPVSSKVSFQTKAAFFNGSSSGPADRTKIWVALSANY